MKFNHKHLDEMYRAYSASTMEIDGEIVALVASEEKGHPCYMYSGENFENRTTVWEDGGGCMSIINIPNKENEFLAIRDFYLKVSPSKAKLVWGKYSKESGWEIKDVLSLPYLHRFDIYNLGNINYVVLATIADDKDYKEDWTRPGSIYYGVLPSDPTQGINLTKLASGFFRNHGYYRSLENEIPVGYFTSDEGIIKVTPYTNKKWEIEKIFDGQIGEVALYDIDSDGKLELITIEPFHGDIINIYHYNEKNEYEVVFTYPFKINFAHSLIGATLNGQPCFVGGVRRVNGELFVITYENGDYKVTIIDEGAGPSNLAVGHRDGQDFIVSANHTRNESAIYFVK